MKEVVLTREKVAIVDDEDYERVSAFKWQARKGKRDSTWYARKSGSVLMHRFILGLLPQGPKVDHKDGNGLNNTRQNLRIASVLENNRSRGMARNNTSGFKGVRCLGGRWYAYISINGKAKHFGGFASAEEAARGYDCLAVEHYGEFARLNFPREAAV